jgi:hypothetical protein
VELAGTYLTIYLFDLYVFLIYCLYVVPLPVPLKLKVTNIIEIRTRRGIARIFEPLFKIRFWGYESTDAVKLKVTFENY